MTFWECIVILLVTVIVVKPDRLPEIAYYIGRVVRKCKQWYQALQQKYDFFE